MCEILCDSNIGRGRAVAMLTTVKWVWNCGTVTVTTGDGCSYPLTGLTNSVTQKVLGYTVSKLTEPKVKMAAKMAA